LRNLFPHVTFIEPEAVAQVNWIFLRFEANVCAQIVNGEATRTVIVEVHNRTITSWTEAIGSRVSLVQ
jgi:hypothetical protein